MGRTLPKVLDRDEARAILSSFHTRYRSQHRNQLALRIMLETGLRAGEVVALRKDHVDLEKCRITIREGKGAKDRTVWFNGGLREEIEAFLERDDLPETEYLLPTRTGNPVDTSQLRKAVSKAVDRAGDAVSEPDRVSCHTFRHSYATMLYRETGNLRLVQENLGHEDIRTTEIYTHLVNGEREEAGRTFSFMEG